MAIPKIKDVIKKLNKVKANLEDGDKYGPIPYIDEAIENLERAIEELGLY